MQFGAMVIGLGFSFGQSSPDGAGLGSLNSIAREVSWFWGGVGSNFREIFHFLSVKFMLLMAIFGLE